MTSNRRGFLGLAGLAALGSVSGSTDAGAAQVQPVRRGHSIGVSTYSFWQFRGQRLGMAACIEKAAAMGFDGVEILHVQMEDESPSAVNKLKAQAHSLGLALMGFSTHQGFVSPDADLRRTNVQKTMYQIELAASLGIATMRINTGRWGTIKSFDDFMAKKGIEPNLEGHTASEAFHSGYRKGPRKRARTDREDGRQPGADRAGAGQDVLRRRPLVRAGSGLREDRQDFE